jgi:hypothetical protein
MVLCTLLVEHDLLTMQCTQATISLLASSFRDTTSHNRCIRQRACAPIQHRHNAALISGPKMVIDIFWTQVGCEHASSFGLSMCPNSIAVAYEHRAAASAHILPICPSCWNFLKILLSHRYLLIATISIQVTTSHTTAKIVLVACPRSSLRTSESLFQSKQHGVQTTRPRPSVGSRSSQRTGRR